MTEKDLKYQELKRAYDKLLEENKRLKINNQIYNLNNLIYINLYKRIF